MRGARDSDSEPAPCESSATEEQGKQTIPLPGSRPLRRSKAKHQHYNGPRNPELPGDPVILVRSEHCISRRDIDPDALKVMQRLLRNGYQAFLVGGAVRDLLLRRTPKDYDVGTDAAPEEVRTLFRNSRIIGRRFKINHVYFRSNKIIEVSTFRASSAADPESDAGPLTWDNTYGDPQTDAVRRDLTVNGLFYDLSTFSVIDYVGGIQDLRNRVIRIIGDPQMRIQEDPVRMIRAVRHAARINFEIEAITYNAICQLKDQLKLCSSARIYEEFVRELRGGSSKESFRLLYETGLLAYLLPVLSEALDEDYAGVSGRLGEVLARADACAGADKEISAAVLFLNVFIGNLPKARLAAPSFGDLARFWELLPEAVHCEEEEESQPDSEAQPFLAQRHGAMSRGRRSRRSKQTQLSKAISELVEVIGVPRREREHMEELLVARYSLLSDAGDESVRGQAKKSHSENLELLLHLLGQREMLQQTRRPEMGDGERPGRPRRKWKRRRRRRRKPEP
jgi:poly(A) polymerase